MKYELWKFEWKRNVKIETIDGSILLCRTEDFFDKDDTESELDEIGLVVDEILTNNSDWKKTRYCLTAEDIKNISFIN